MNEMVILVDPHDRQIGVEEKMRAHRQGKLHRAFSVFVFNEKGEMLLQQRAPHKYHSAGLWTNACCSHPRPGETLEQAAARRLQEEMGFVCELKKAFHFIYKAEVDGGLIEHEFDHVFVGSYNGEIHPNANEVTEYRWLNIQTLKLELENFSERFTVWFKIANELFLKWVATKINQPEERRNISMNDLPEVKRVRLDKDIIALCKEFRGPYAEAPKYVTEVKDYFDTQKIAYRHQHVLGVYFDDPNQPNPETHRSIQGVVVDKEVDVKPPYFVYKMKKGDEYLYTKVKGNPIDTHLFIPAGYMAIFNYMGMKKIQAGSTGGHQVVTMEDGKVVFEIYLNTDFH